MVLKLTVPHRRNPRMKHKPLLAGALNQHGESFKRQRMIESDNKKREMTHALSMEADESQSWIAFLARH
jgi:hypothetical protein